MKKIKFTIVLGLLLNVNNSFARVASQPTKMSDLKNIQLPNDAEARTLEENVQNQKANIAAGVIDGAAKAGTEALIKKAELLLNQRKMTGPMRNMFMPGMMAMTKDLKDAGWFNSQADNVLVDAELAEMPFAADDTSMVSEASYDATGAEMAYSDDMSGAADVSYDATGVEMPFADEMTY